MRVLAACPVLALLLAGCFPNPLPDGEPLTQPAPDPADDCPDAPMTYADDDGDGFGDPGSGHRDCHRPQAVTNGDDCDDLDPSVHPDAVEVCDGQDQDCDGAIDEEAVDARTFFLDRDGDGFGSLPLGAGCTLPAGTAEVDGDCDDADAAVWPGAPEPVCTLVDLDCDGQAGFAAAYGDRGFDTIQAALDASGEGARVVVCEGNHIEALRVDHGVRLLGEIPDPERVQLAAPPGERVLTGSGDWFTLRGLTLVGETVAEGDGAIARLRSTTLHVEACRFVGGHAPNGSGGALAWRGVTSADGTPAEARVEDTWLDDGQAGRGGAAWLELQAGGRVELDGLRVRDNAASTDGGGIGVRIAGADGRLEVVDSRFDGNGAGDRGGALFFAGGSRGEASIEASRLADSEAAVGSGVATTGGRLGLDRTLLDGNVGEGVLDVDGSRWDGSGVTSVVCDRDGCE